MFDLQSAVAGMTAGTRTQNGGPGPRPMGRDVSKDMVQSKMGAPGCSCSGGLSKRTKTVLGLAAIGAAIYLYRRG